MVAEGGLVKVIHRERLIGREYTSEGMDICSFYMMCRICYCNVDACGFLMEAVLVELAMRAPSESERKRQTECSSRSLWVMAVIELVSLFGRRWAECERVPSGP